jgi:hypothetical protein
MPMLPAKDATWLQVPLIFSKVLMVAFTLPKLLVVTIIACPAFPFRTPILLDAQILVVHLTFVVPQGFVEYEIYLVSESGAAFQVAEYPY